MTRVSIVIPCYNEQHRLPLDEYRRFLSTRAIRLIFVNDGSTDGTVSVLEALREQFPSKVTVVNLACNSGKAAAVRAGILHSLRSGTDITGFLDADLSTPLGETRHFLYTFRRTNAEFVFGSRISRIGAQIRRFHHRHYFGRVVASLISIYLGIPVYDSQCGAKFFRAELARDLFREPFVSSWLFDVELFKRIEQTGRVIEACSIELPLDCWIEKGASKIRARDFIRLPLQFGRIMAHYRGGPSARVYRPGSALLQEKRPSANIRDAT